MVDLLRPLESSNDMRWPKTKEEHAYMKMRQEQNLVACKNVPAERWMQQYLSATGLKWKRQRQWGYRLFDFFNVRLGIAVEVDGATHSPSYDAVRDEYNYKTSGITVCVFVISMKMMRQWRSQRFKAAQHGTSDAPSLD